MPKNDEIDLIIEVLEEARLRSLGRSKREDIGEDTERLRIIQDLIEEDMVWGENKYRHTAHLVKKDIPPDITSLNGIKLKGRRYLQELRDYKQARGFWGRYGQTILVFAGAVTGALAVLAADILHSWIKLWYHLP